MFQIYVCNFTKRGLALGCFFVDSLQLFEGKCIFYILQWDFQFQAVIFFQTYGGKCGYFDYKRLANRDLLVQSQKLKHHENV